MIQIDLTLEDAELFKRFQQRYLFMQLLESVKAFDIRSGSLEVHFNAQGEIAMVEKHECYKIP